VFKNRMLRKIFGPRKSGGNSIMNYMICPPDYIFMTLGSRKRVGHASHMG
jgi:hypothetical protein